MFSNVIAQLTGWHNDGPQNSTSQAKEPSRDSLLARIGILGRTPADNNKGFSNSLHDSNELDIETRKNILCHRLRIATTQAEWHYTAAELDDLEGNNDWKFELECKEYDYALVQARLAEFEDARISCDPRRMLFLIRTALTRHVGGMGNIRLYRHSHVGTKVLIEKYRDCVLDTIKTFLDTTKQQQDGLDPRHLLDQVLASRQSFGRSALLLSGGGTFGMNHIGVVKCLWENNLLPRVITGASAGSIVSAVLCTKKDTEMDGLLEEFCHGDLNVFTSKDDSILKQLTRFMKTGALFDIGNLTRIMRNLMGDLTFLEAYNRTRRILNICVSSASVFELPRLLNHITAPNVIIWSAVYVAHVKSLLSSS
jgi:TAG lipase/steryl ester hydrolase/phospholipase A2/LPA acyltransferase